MGVFLDWVARVVGHGLEVVGLPSLQVQGVTGSLKLDGLAEMTPGQQQTALLELRMQIARTLGVPIEQISTSIGSAAAGRRLAGNTVEYTIIASGTSPAALLSNLKPGWTDEVRVLVF